MRLPVASNSSTGGAARAFCWAVNLRPVSLDVPGDLTCEELAALANLGDDRRRCRRRSRLSPTEDAFGCLNSTPRNGRTFADAQHVRLDLGDANVHPFSEPSNFRQGIRFHLIDFDGSIVDPGNSKAIQTARRLAGDPGAVVQRVEHTEVTSTFEHWMMVGTSGDLQHLRRIADQVNPTLFVRTGEAQRTQTDCAPPVVRYRSPKQRSADEDSSACRCGSRRCRGFRGERHRAPRHCHVLERNPHWAHQRSVAYSLGPCSTTQSEEHEPPLEKGPPDHRLLPGRRRRTRGLWRGNDKHAGRT